MVVPIKEYWVVPTIAGWGSLGDNDRTARRLKARNEGRGTDRTQIITREQRHPEMLL